MDFLTVACVKMFSSVWGMRVAIPSTWANVFPVFSTFQEKLMAKPFEV